MQLDLKEMGVQYDDTLEELLKKASEESESLAILHRYCYQKFNLISNITNVLVIVLSGAIGFMQAYNLQNFEFINLILGLVSLVVGLIKSVETFFALTQRASQHKMCYLQYSMIHKKILVELALHRDDRQDPKEMLAVIKNELKSLEEVSPIIIKSAIQKYLKKYGLIPDICQPSLVNGLTKVVVNKPSHPKPPSEPKPPEIPLPLNQSQNLDNFEEVQIKAEVIPFEDDGAGVMV